MHLFFQPNLESNTLFLSEEESKHCVRVLRLRKGQIVHLADGKGTEAVASIADDHPKRCELTIEERKQHPPAISYRLHIRLAPTKNTERVEWFVEKAVEAGISSIGFIETQHTERTKMNMERLEKIAVSAMKQSKQWHLPTLLPVTPFKEALQQLPQDALKIIAWCEQPETTFIQKAFNPTQKELAILIGPEGDFTAAETAAAASAGCKPVSLGPTILRTETAALFACMAVKTAYTG